MDKQRGVNKLSVSELSTIEEQTRELEAVVGNQDDLRTSLQDPAALKRKLANNKAIIARDYALRAKGRQKDAIVREIRQIEGEIQKHRPTRRMMELRPGSVEFNKAVRANVEFHRKFGGMMNRLKDLKRRLEPDDPESGNLEHIRPE